MLTRRPRGTADVLPDEVAKWQHLEQKIREICTEYGYQEIRTPVFEHTELFQRGLGEGTDIVEKEMYVFKDRGGRSLTLRPEGTAAAARAYLENNLYAGPQPTKLYYVEPLFRYERPQAGRLRQHTQFGIEVFGTQHPAVDAEIIGLAVDFLGRFGLDNLQVRINSLGCPGCRSGYRERLLEYFRPHLDQLCPDCLRRFEKNPLRLLDCKVEECRRWVSEAPSMLDFLCEECGVHFEHLRGYLEILNIKYEIDPGIVRGLDYYTKTVFEIKYQDLGAQDTVCGGGRYDGLMEECGGPRIPASGFGLGLERLLHTLEKEGYAFPEPVRPWVYLVTAGEKAFAGGFRLLAELRREGFPSDMDYLGRSLRSQMKQAHKARARYAVILGEEELARGTVTLRDLDRGEQREIPARELITELRKSGDS